jgi:ABC-type multidrug transport system permease subunit
MFAWFPYLKEFSMHLALGAVFSSTLAWLWLYKRRQLLRRVPLAENIAQQQRFFLRNGIAGLVISLLLLSLYCCIEIFSSASVVTILGTLSLSLIGVSLLSGLLILVEKSKWRDQP